MKKFFIGLELIVGLVLSQGAARADCLSDFRSSMSGVTAFQNRQTITMALTTEQIGCIFESASLEAMEADAKPVTLSDFYGYDHPLDQVVQFSGKSSLPVFSYFEKHFFFVHTEGKLRMFGYNYSSTMQWLGGAGFLAVDRAASGTYLTGDYTLDFTSVIPEDQFEALLNRDVATVSNNSGTHALVYGNLVDTFYQVLPDVYVNEGRNPQPDGTTKHLVYFILIRKPILPI